MTKKRILSGMRPTGKLHLGHLVGALSNWTSLQDEYDCFFMVADWHALMSEYENPGNIKENILDNVIDWLACGVDPNKSNIFIQSQIPEHLELYFILSLITPLGLLERCPTYKEQLREVLNRDLSTYAFLGYPVLQAADILLYKADTVPVGEDQLPHLELARQIVRKFNNLYKTDCLLEPKALLTKTNRLLGLDGRKMSKSYNNYIALSEEPQVIRKKVQSMITDPKRIRITDSGHPHKCNVCCYYMVFFPNMEKEVYERCSKSKIGCTECKKELADKLVSLLAPIQEKRQELLKDKKYIQEILFKGNSGASELAKKTIAQVKGILKVWYEL
ncbi:MAG: tryptophan--tRNA ligase [Candidatus Omnitrophica bacterium]|jgi:tryptophanyl-tRNA synthetase|nr:tryptophan--tRNA ligase [Candidatus Omnitrophota bacterium]MDD5660707.1 tryptophan--tRNA ligase [Candidatus Omnitrophota bacterium]